ncbi:MAG: SusC/RagA family TonB-linked outer membrane protein [Bacteroidetes bacterium]|nr:SusC/RagA family TonB-linked outer membrane protein [Bacteroidota bacterium]
MRKITILLTFLFFIGTMGAFAQSRTVSGKVTSSEDGSGIPGVSVFVKGTTVGTVTDLDGNFSLEIDPTHRTLVFQYVGMETQEVEIGQGSNFDVILTPDAILMEEVVVTALGISREKKSLGYATQELEGDEISTIKRDNFINNLQGKSAGVSIKGTGNIGGSANVIIRGSSSLTQNNQALFVVDGVPIDNSNMNNTGQLSGRSGYDYGNAASDINPNDIESMSILKGAAATALYGSRAANGVIIITTKKGATSMGKAKIYGVTLNSNITGGWYDKSTFPKYQKEYGAGYGTDLGWYNGEEEGNPGFEYYYDVDGDGTTDFTVPTYDDASMGQAFDPNISLFQYDSYYPSSPNYHKKTPWVAPENGPEYFLQTAYTLSNSVQVAGGGAGTAFRLGYTNLDQRGIMPNSSLKKNNLNFNGSYEITENLKISASANYINTKGKGRNSTGYSDNVMSSFRQWMQTNVDYKMQETLYESGERNLTWNPNSPTDLAPAYWDNPFFQRYQSYETDERNRIIGYVMAEWQIIPSLSLMGRASIDTYSELQQDRKAVGSASGEFGVGRPDVTSGYSELSHSFMETNFDAMLKYYKNFGEDWNLTALLGTNIRRNKDNRTFASTDGGLIVPGLYTLGNSANPNLAPEQDREEIGVNGVYLSASVGFRNFMFLDATIRRDVSSTLPEDNNAYFYPSVSASWLFSTNLDASWLQLGKLRASFAQVGNDAPWGSLEDNYIQNTSFGVTPLFSLPASKANSELKPEISSGIEAGLEMVMFNKRLGFDFSFYKTNTVNQILPVSVSYATGYSSKWVNAGEVQNMGFEVVLNGAAVASKNFRWDISANFAKNNNEVIALTGDIENLQIAALQGGVTINARVGEPYGAIQGTDYIYTNGEKTVGEDGYYLKTGTSDKVIGNVNPDFTMGLNNKFSYKNWDLSFLIDWQQGGSIFSLDMWYGMGTGLYEETSYINDLGNPVRNSLEDGGGLILEGVNEDGTPNETRVSGANYRVFGWSKNPNAGFIYDATYIKLRELVISYSIPQNVMQKANWIHGATFSLVGSNLWIMYKDLPHADPEASQSSGNVQGWQSGVMPTVRQIGFSVNLQF